GRRVVVDARQIFFIDRHHHHETVFLGSFAHQLGRGTVGDPLRQGVPFTLLLRTEVRTIKELLQTDHLGSPVGGRGDELEVLLDHGLLDPCHRCGGWFGKFCLDQSPPDDTRHNSLLSWSFWCLPAFPQSHDHTGEWPPSKVGPSAAATTHISRCTLGPQL